MKKIHITLLLILALPALIQAQPVIRLTNGEWAPYLSEHLPHNGFASHIVKEAFNAVDIQVEYGFFPWKRSYKLARQGNWHGTVVWVHTPERAKDFYYSDPVIVDHEYLFYLKSFNLEWNQVNDLKGLKIGGTLHTAYPVFEAAEKKELLTIERAGTYENLYLRLLKKRIHAIPQVSAVGNFLIRTSLTPQDQSKITYSPTIIETRKYSLILSKAVKGNKVFLNRFNKGFLIIKNNGTFNRLHQKLTQGGYDN